MHKTLTIALAMFAGLVGGLLTRYIAPPAAFAQGRAPVTKEIRAQSFRLVDPLDRAVGVFTAEPTARGGNLNFGGPMRIVLRDAHGREIWSAGGGGVLPASEQ